ncbi:hypothetical protein H0A66_13590 [Alcaligenaceae bacterium]|nr:hypothetical protein [Alcaligenaceae bacterium]
MEQWCTGVVETSHGTWLVGRDDNATGSASYVPNGVPDLSQLVSSEEKTNKRSGFGLLGSRPVLTTLALLQSDGKFKVMATIPAVACMAVSPTSETLFLFTGVDRSGSVSSQEQGQTAIFRSLDHGVTWEWMRSGFMAEIQQIAWSVKPTFASEQDVWAWGKEPLGEDEPVTSRRAADGTELKPSSLFYSADQGETSGVIYGPEPLIVPDSYLREMAGEGNWHRNDEPLQWQYELAK